MYKVPVFCMFNPGSLSPFYWIYWSNFWQKLPLQHVIEGKIKGKGDEKTRKKT